MARRTLKDVEVVVDTGNPVDSPVRSEKEPKAAPDALYSVSELAASARNIFGTRQECVMAALKAAGKTKCSVAEAKEIVEKFLKKEVK